MAQYNNENRGAAFANPKKAEAKEALKNGEMTQEEVDRIPNLTGNLNVGGTEHWLSIWMQKSKDGKDYLSLSVQVKEPLQKQTNEEVVLDESEEPLDLSAIPF